MSISQAFASTQNSFTDLSKAFNTAEQLKLTKEAFEHQKYKEGKFISGIEAQQRVINPVKVAEENRKVIEGLTSEVTDLRLQSVKKQQVEETETAQGALSGVVTSDKATSQAIKDLNNNDKFVKVSKNKGVSNFRSIPRNKQEFEGMVGGRGQSQRAKLIDDMFNFLVTDKEVAEKYGNAGVEEKLNVVLEKSNRLYEAEDKGDTKLNNLVIFEKGGEMIVSDLENTLSNMGLSRQASQLSKRGAVLDDKGEDFFGVNPVQTVSPEQYQAMDEQQKQNYKNSMGEYIKALDVVTNDGKFTDLTIKQQMADTQADSVKANERARLSASQNRAVEEYKFDLYGLYGQVKLYGSKAYFSNERALRLSEKESKELFGEGKRQLFDRMIGADIRLAAEDLGKSPESISTTDLERHYKKEGYPPDQINNLLTEFGKLSKPSESKGLASKAITNAAKVYANSRSNIGFTSRSARIKGKYVPGSSDGNTFKAVVGAANYNLAKNLVGHELYGGALTDSEIKNLEKVLADNDWTGNEEFLSQGLGAIISTSLAEKREQLSTADNYTKVRLNKDIALLEDTYVKLRHSNIPQSTKSATKGGLKGGWFSDNKVSAEYDSIAKNEVMRNFGEVFNDSNINPSTKIKYALEAATQSGFVALNERQKHLGYVDKAGKATKDDAYLEEDSIKNLKVYFSPLVEKLKGMRGLSGEDKSLVKKFIDGFNFRPKGGSSSKPASGKGSSVNASVLSKGLTGGRNAQ